MAATATKPKAKKKFSIANKKKPQPKAGAPARGTIDDAFVKENGGQMLAEGGMAEGPSHEQGGIDVYQQGAEEPTAEIEGGERVFSQEDTELMEQACEKILTTEDKAQADQLAMQLGYAVCEMIQQQQANQSQETEAQDASGEPSAEDVAAMNEM